MDELVAWILLGIAILFLTFLYFNDRINRLERMDATSNIEEQAR